MAAVTISAVVIQLSLNKKACGIAETILLFKKHKPIELADANHKSREHCITSKLLEAITLANASSLSEAKEELLIKGLLCSTPVLVIMSAQKTTRNRKQQAERRHESLSGMYWLKKNMYQAGNMAWLLHCNSPVNHIKNTPLSSKLKTFFKISQVNFSFA